MSTDTELTPTLAGVGTAALSVDIAEVGEDDGYRIHGIALGAGDLTIGQSQTRKYWPADALADAAETLEGRPLVKDHNNSTDGRVGTVTKADFKPSVGVIYEAKIAPHYEDLAKDVASGIMEVSARVKHPDDEELSEHEETGALVVDRLLFDNLSLVNDGAAPSNTAQFGDSPDLSPTAGQQDAAGAPAVASASAGDDGDLATATLERSAEIETDVIADDLAALDPVDSETDIEETDTDELDEGDTEADAEAKSDELSDAEAESTPESETSGADTDELGDGETEVEADTEGDELSETPDNESDTEAETDAESESEPVSESPTESTSEPESESESESDEATPEHDDPDTDAQASDLTVASLSYYSSTTMTESEFTEVDEDAIEELNDPVLVERETVEELNERAETADTVDERLEELNEKVDVVDQVDDDALEELAETEDPVVLESEELAEKEGLVDEVGTVFAEELATGSSFSAEELTDRFSPTELREKLVGDDGDVGEELSETVSEEPEPEGETVESEELSESTDDVEREKAEELAREQVAEELAERGWQTQAEKVREGDIALDELGVEIDY